MAGLLAVGLVPWRLVAAEPKKETRGEQDAAATNITGDQAKRQQEAVEAILDLGNGEPNIGYGNRESIDHDEKGIPCSVVFSGPKVTDAHLKLLKDLPELKYLCLLDTHVTENGLDELKQLPNLEYLRLQGPLSSDSALQHLRGLTHLHGLGCDGTKITDSGLEQTQGLSELRSLLLAGNKITDAGLKHLVSLAHLQELTLLDSAVSVVGLEQLKGLRELRALYLDTRILGKAKIGNIQTLQRAMPQCQIVGLSTGPGPAASYTPPTPYSPYSAMPPPTTPKLQEMEYREYRIR